LADVDPAFADVRADLTFSAETADLIHRGGFAAPGARLDAHVFRRFRRHEKAGEFSLRSGGQDPYRRYSRAPAVRSSKVTFAGWDQSGVANSFEAIAADAGE